MRPGGRAGTGVGQGLCEHEVEGKDTAAVRAMYAWISSRRPEVSGAYPKRAMHAFGRARPAANDLNRLSRGPRRGFFWPMRCARFKVSRFR